MNYVEKLTALREDRDITQAEIAELLHCTQSTVSKCERGLVAYSIEDLISLCNFYNISSDYLFGLPRTMPYPER